MCYDRTFRIPWALYGPVRAYIWNERCLRAPKPYIDSDGIYFHFERRKVVPGLVPVPTGFEALDIERNRQLINQHLNNIIKNNNQAINKLLKSFM